MRCFFSHGCACIFVKSLQDGFTKTTNARNDKTMTMRCFFLGWMRFYLCKIMLPKPAVGNSSPFLTNLPFHDFTNISTTNRGSQIYAPQTKILDG
jgi:hypothetical protein